MTKRAQQPPWYLLHQVFARPLHVCWALGTIGLWIPVTLHLQATGIFSFLISDWTALPLVVLSYAASSGLGFYAGLFGAGWWILPICRRLNGAPHEVGESVAVLTGPCAGRIATIYRIDRGQGGQPVPRVDLGEGPGQAYQDSFEEYSLLRLTPPTAEGLPTGSSRPSGSDLRN